MLLFDLTACIVQFVSIPSAMDSKESESGSEKDDQLPVHQLCAMI